MAEHHGAQLSQVLWMGGSPCAGKSAIARILAGRYGLQTYAVDDALREQHMGRILPGEYPTLYKWHNTGWNELWMQRASVLLVEAKAAYREHFQMVLEDLLALSPSTPMLVEGNPLLPDQVSPLLMHPWKAIWVVPTEGFQRRHYPQRGPWVQEILSHCEDPEQALQNWMDRDVAFAHWISARVHALGLASIEVDGTHTIADNARRIAAHFQLS